jgi:hypothetical protein
VAVGIHVFVALWVGEKYVSAVSFLGSCCARESVGKKDIFEIVILICRWEDLDM